jgi:hypothetical protein
MDEHPYAPELRQGPLNWSIVTSLRVAALALAALLAAGCGGAATSSSASGTSPAASSSTQSAPPAAASSTPSAPSTPASANSASPATTASTPAAGPTHVPMQTAAGGEFLSPSGNISCEVDYHRNGLTQAYCQTIAPPRSVTMDATGTYKTCTGQQCLGNPGTNTPTLAYGTATGAGPFLCQSATTGITCVAAGQGFRISTSGITPA